MNLKIEKYALKMVKICTLNTKLHVLENSKTSTYINCIKIDRNFKRRNFLDEKYKLIKKVFPKKSISGRSFVVIFF